MTIQIVSKAGIAAVVKAPRPCLNSTWLNDLMRDYRAGRLGPLTLYRK